jgi:apolipoprotein N-acyltransferase
MEEYTGTGGGTLWVLLSNILIWILLKEYKVNGRSKKYFAQLVCYFLLLILPISFSFLTKSQTSNLPDRRAGIQHSTYNIVVVQPNIDPYEKVSTGTFEAQLQKLIVTTEKEMDDLTGLVVWPETALYMENRINESEMKENFFLDPLWSFLKRHPNTLFTGIESYRRRQVRPRIQWLPFESYNGSVLLTAAVLWLITSPCGVEPALVPEILQMVRQVWWYYGRLQQTIRKIGATESRI